MATATFPTKQEDKNNYYHSCRARIDSDQLRLGITPAHVTEIDNLIDSPNFWDDIWGKHISESGDSTTVQARLIQLIPLVEDKLDEIFKDIPASKLTSDDYVIFHLNPGGSSHAHIIAQKTAGILSLDSAHHLGHRMRIKNPVTPEKDAMPHGNHAKVWWVVLPTRIPAADIVWGSNPKTMTTRFLEMSFTEEQVGKFAAYTARYENAQGEQGDPSDPIWVVII